MIVYYYDVKGDQMGAGDSATLPDNATGQMPKTENDKWDGSQWVTPDLSPDEIKERERRDAEALRNQTLSNLTVTTSSGKTFDANNQARLDMQSGITAAIYQKKTKERWRLADNSEKEITLDELQEASALAIQAYATVKKIGV